MHTLKTRTYVNADSSKVVPEGSVEAAFLLGLAGDEISDETASRLGLTGADTPAGYASMKVPELRALADERGVEYASDAKKADLVDALEDADEAADAVGSGDTAEVASPAEA